MSTSIADAISKALNELQKQIDELKAQMATRSVTTTTPPTADGEGLPGFVILDAKPETEYKNYDNYRNDQTMQDLATTEGMLNLSLYGGAYGQLRFRK